MRISAEELKLKFESGEDFQLIDLRENYEFNDFNIGGINIPLDDVLKNLKKLTYTKPIVFCCNEGLKSHALVIALKRKISNKKLYSLDGGISSYLETYQV